jgi:hypothetical protein
MASTASLRVLSPPTLPKASDWSTPETGADLFELSLEHQENRKDIFGILGQNQDPSVKTRLDILDKTKCHVSNVGTRSFVLPMSVIKISTSTI